MRLGQIARKLNEDTETLVSFLKSEGVQIENSPNTKIEDKIADLLNTKFKSNNLTSFTNEKTDNQNLTPKEEKKEVAEILSDLENSRTNEDLTSISKSEEHSTKEEQKDSSEDNLSPQIKGDPTPPTTEPLIENDYKVNEIDGVIRAPKQQLEGIKVVGKIKLPQQKQKLDKNTSVEKPSPDTTKNKDGTIDIEESKIHPNKKGRVVAPKRNKISEKTLVPNLTDKEKTLSKEELKAKRKTEKRRKIAKKKKEKQRTQSITPQLVEKEKPKKIKKTSALAKKTFWERWFGW